MYPFCDAEVCQFYEQSANNWRLLCSLDDSDHRGWKSWQEVLLQPRDDWQGAMWDIFMGTRCLKGSGIYFAKRNMCSDMISHAHSLPDMEWRNMEKRDVWCQLESSLFVRPLTKACKKHPNFSEGLTMLLYLAISCDIPIPCRRIILQHLLSCNAST